MVSQADASTSEAKKAEDDEDDDFDLFGPDEVGNNKVLVIHLCVCVRVCAYMHAWYVCVCVSVCAHGYMNSSHVYRIGFIKNP